MEKYTFLLYHIMLQIASTFSAHEEPPLAIPFGSRLRGLPQFSLYTPLDAASVA